MTVLLKLKKQKNCMESSVGDNKQRCLRSNTLK